MVPTRHFALAEQVVCAGSATPVLHRWHPRLAAFTGSKSGHQPPRQLHALPEQSDVDSQAQCAREPAQQRQQQEQQQRPLVWCQGITQGTFFDEVRVVLPEVTWKSGNLVRVMVFGLPAAAAAVLINTRLAALFTSSSSGSNAATTTSLLSLNDPSSFAAAAVTSSSAAAAAAGLAAASPAQQALIHLSQEAVLAALMPAAVWLALGPRVAAAKWDPYWAVETLATCAVLFPLVDPVLYNAWQPVVQAVVGPAPISSLVTTLHQTADAGDWGSVGMHCLSSGVVGPIWEEVFWRGFFLTALTKVLPLPACVALSSLNFAVLHLSPHNLLPLLVLSACCDCLYLRSGGNLLAPLLLHGLWNSSQVLQISLLHKDTFV